ncbi:MAG: hypothetical protein K9L65_13895 [Chromatiaceae bacterium]|nr:hypothetical protein [Chromatiaceae bacterium]
MIDSMTAGEIANDWALACCETLERRDIEGHMNLISRRVKVYGLANLDVVDYHFWLQQVQEQFAAGLVTSLRYYLNAVKVDSDTQLRLTAIEYLTDKDGSEHESPLLITLCKEADGVWRATEEKILTKDEAQTAGLSRLH